MTRRLAVGLLLVAISPARPVAAQSAMTPFIDEPLPAGVHVRVSNGPEGMIGVDIGTDRAWRVGAPQSLDGIDVQVWLLKADGTALPQRRPGGGPVQVSMIRNGQRHLQRLLYGFEAADRQELAAVVVSLDGVLFVRRISRTPSN